MTRSVPYDATRRSLYQPGEAGDFFESWGNQSDVALCAEMSRLAYCRDLATTRKGLARVDFELVHDPFDRESTFAFLARGEGRRVLVFRGTEPKDPRDALDDAFILLQPWSGMGKVHMGFAGALERIWSDLRPTLEDADAPLLMTGHSLGAALATLASALHPPSLLISFGSPRVGDVEFATTVENRVKAVRYVNCCDLVTRLPLVPYKHIGRLLYIDRLGEVHESPGDLVIRRDCLKARLDYFWRYSWRLIRNILTRDFADHSPANYVLPLRNG